MMTRVPRYHLGRAKMVLHVQVCMTLGKARSRYLVVYMTLQRVLVRRKLLYTSTGTVLLVLVYCTVLEYFLHHPLL